MKTNTILYWTLLAVSTAARSTISKRAVACTPGEKITDLKSNKTFVIECGTAHFGGNVTQHGIGGGWPKADNITVCARACALNKDCILAEWESGTFSCRHKAAYGVPVYDENVIAARLEPQNGATDPYYGNATVPGPPYANTTTVLGSGSVTANSSMTGSASASWLTLTVTRNVTSTRLHTVTASSIATSSSSQSVASPSEVYVTVTVPWNASTTSLGDSTKSAPTSIAVQSSSTTALSSALPSTSSADYELFYTRTFVSAAPQPPKSQGKRGLLYNDAKFTKNFGGVGSKVSWASNWHFDRYVDEHQQEVSIGQFNPALEFVPQLWNVSSENAFQGYMGGAKSATDGNAGVTNLLAFNEPNQCGGGGTCMQKQADLLVESYMKMLQPRGKTAKLGSPSVTNGPDGISWLKEFMQKCSKCQIDFVQAHWYGGGIDDFKPYIEKFHEAFPDKPIWLTEFALDGNGDKSPEYANRFLKDAMAYMDGTDYIERYAFFMAAPLGDSRALVNEDGSLTEIGKVYNAG